MDSLETSRISNHLEQVLQVVPEIQMLRLETSRISRVTRRQIIILTLVQDPQMDRVVRHLLLVPHQVQHLVRLIQELRMLRLETSRISRHKHLVQPESRRPMQMPREIMAITLRLRKNRNLNSPNSRGMTKPLQHFRQHWKLCLH